MVLYYSLRAIANALDDVRREFYNLYVATRNVYLIGTYLSVRFLAISNFVLQIEARIVDTSYDWRDFYEWLVDNIDVSGAISELIRYADDLISFIRYPFDWIGDTIQERFPALYAISRDPVEWVLETIYRYTGLDIDFVDDPRRIIRNIVHEIVGDVLDVLRDPLGWVRDVLHNLIPDFGLFISNPRAWVADRLDDAFPFAYDFLRDPDGFIRDRLFDFLDDLADRYRDKAIRLVEKILQAIF